MASIGENGYLKRLKDVLFSSPANGDVVTYAAADGKWENKPNGGGGGGSGNFGPTTPFVTAQWGGGGLIASGTNQDVAFDNVTITQVNGDTTTAIAWDAGTPTDLVIDDGIYAWAIKIALVAGTGGTSVSPAKLTVTGGSTQNQVDDMVGTFWNDAAYIPVLYTTFGGDSPTVLLTGFLIASGESRSAGKSIASLNFAASLHGVQVDNAYLTLAQVGSIS